VNKIKVLSGLLITITFIFSTVALADFQQRVLEEITAGHAYPCASANCPTPAQISQYQFIFIEGFLARPNGRNFVPLETVIKDQFNDNDYMRLLPSSANSISTNVPIIYNQIQAFRAKSPQKKAILVAHSKGAAETLLIALLHPEIFTNGLISEMVFVDGAFNGTPLTYLWNDLCHLGRMPEVATEDLDLCHIIAGWADGVNSMKPTNIKPIIAKAISAVRGEDIALVNKHLWSVQSQFGDLKTEWKSKLLIPWGYLKIFGDNDGVILTKDENLEKTWNLGTNLGVFFADHTSLLGGSSVASAESEREGFARALVREMVLQGQ
jgi:pimeloyl-ACP methyl ester carboxylesterase